MVCWAEVAPRWAWNGSGGVRRELSEEEGELCMSEQAQISSPRSQPELAMANRPATQDPAFDKVYHALSGIRGGTNPNQAATNTYATINAMAMMMNQLDTRGGGAEGGAASGYGGGPPPGTTTTWQCPPPVQRRGGRVLLGRGVETGIPRNYSDSSLARGGPAWAGSTHSLGPQREWDNVPYSESLARFSVATPPSRLYRPQGRSNPFPSPPDYDIDDFGLDDILNNRAMLAAANAVGGTYPPRSNIRRSKMIYYLKFGEQGQEPGKFSEPSGVAVTPAGDLVVADTNNHRIQVFYPDGRFKFAFGECGKRDGQLLYPNRVTVNRKTGDIVITERSPTHQIQVYNQYGQFLSKFGATILQHPRGVCVDGKGRIIVVECKVMRVLIFEMGGALVGRFDCSAHLEFPNGVCVNEAEEIFVSDNRAHAVKVFDYEGCHLRTIGGEGITNFPIGVGINHLGQVVIADNHNNFNITVFESNGTLVYGQESRVKHAQCFDVALLEDGSVALASKDYRLYLYRYALAQTESPPPTPDNSPNTLSPHTLKP